MPLNQTNLRRVFAAALKDHLLTFNGFESAFRDEFSLESPNPAILQVVLKEFDINRNLSQSGRSSLLRSMRTLAKALRSSGWDHVLDLTIPATAQGQIPRYFIEGSFTNKAKSKLRTPVSAITKVLWFAGGHDLPMFDKWTRAAVKARGASLREECSAFYKTLSTVWCADEASKRTQAIFERELPANVFGNGGRYLDKLLMSHTQEAQGGLSDRFDDSILMARLGIDVSRIADCLENELCDSTFIKKLQRI